MCRPTETAAARRIGGFMRPNPHSEALQDPAS
jgi:hypothetical protein